MLEHSLGRYMMGEIHVNIYLRYIHTEHFTRPFSLGSGALEPSEDAVLEAFGENDAADNIGSMVASILGSMSAKN